MIVKMEPPVTARVDTPSTDSVFHSVEDSLDDVFYEEPTPTSAVVTAVDQLPSLRLRHVRENPPNSSDTESTRPSHPLSAAYYEMPSAGDDRYCECIVISLDLTFSFACQ